MVNCPPRIIGARAAQVNATGGRLRMSVARRREPNAPARRSGFAAAELLVALAILSLAVMPLAFSFIADGKLLRASYERAVAMELVDGEMEVLAAGAWRHYPAGVHPYPLTGTAATNLPAGRCELTITNDLIRLEWKTDKARGVGAVVREVKRHD